MHNHFYYGSVIKCTTLCSRSHFITHTANTHFYENQTVYRKLSINIVMHSSTSQRQWWQPTVCLSWVTHFLWKSIHLTTSKSLCDNLFNWILIAVKFSWRLGDKHYEVSWESLLFLRQCRWSYIKGIIHRFFFVLFLFLFFILNYVIPLNKTSWCIPLSSQCVHSIALVCETLW